MSGAETGVPLGTVSGAELEIDGLALGNGCRKANGEELRQLIQRRGENRNWNGGLRFERSDPADRRANLDRLDILCLGRELAMKNGLPRTSFTQQRGGNITNDLGLLSGCFSPNRGEVSLIELINSDLPDEPLQWWKLRGAGFRLLRRWQLQKVDVYVVVAI